MEKELIKEISCSAKNCVYNENGCKCVAGHIDVGTTDAQSSGETRCSTFKNSDHCGCSDSCKI